MSTKNFQTMKELAAIIREKTAKLEEGKLPAEELGELADEIRDLYDRIVVLQYKALEKGLKVDKAKPDEHKPIEKKIEEVEVPAFKFNVSEPKTAETTMEELTAKTISEEDDKQAGLFDENVKTKQDSSSGQKVSIAEKYASQHHTSIAEKFAAEPKMTLADKLKMTRINDLRSAIGINQKFLFMNDLFEGENTVFNDAINRLNSCSNGNEAQTILGEYAQKYGWNYDAERVLQFAELVQRRYL